MDDINDRARDPASREPGAVLNEVLSNPALLQSIAAAIRGTGGSASTEEACAETVATPLQEGSSEDGIAHVLSDPALMQKLPEVMATIAPLYAPPKKHSRCNARGSEYLHPPDRDNGNT